MQKQETASKLAEKRFNYQKARLKHMLAVEQFENGQMKKAKRTLQEAIALYPDDPSFGLLLAKLHLETGELAKARRLLETMMLFDNPAPEFSYLLGLVQERSQRPQQALDHYRAAHELEPSKAEYLMAYAEALISLRKPAEAMYLIDENLHEVDERGRLHALKGNALQVLGRYEEAAYAFQQALVEIPEDALLLESFALSLFWGGQYAEAISPLRALQTSLNGEMPVHAQRALARCYLEIGDNVTALAHLRRITRIDPHDDQAWLMLARSEIALDNLVDARIAAKRTVLQSPQKAGSQTILGYVLFQQEDWPAARRALEAGIRVDPSDSLALCLLGRVSEVTGSPEQAAAFYKRAMELDPHGALGRHLYEKLQEAGCDETLIAGQS